MRTIMMTLGRAVASQLHARMLLLTVLPSIFSIILWGIVLWLGLEPVMDWLREIFGQRQSLGAADGIVDWVGMDVIRAIAVPLIAMWMLLPLMILTTLVFVGTMAMPTIARHVGSRQYPALEMRHGGNFWGSLRIAVSSFCIFILVWIVTLPLSLVPPMTFVIQPALWGWLTYRVMAYDALAEHADKEERRLLLRLHRWPLLLIGVITGALSAIPTLLWLGGPLAIIFLPVLSAAAIWMYVLVFVFTGLWFQHYCLEALWHHRLHTGAQPDEAADRAAVTMHRRVKQINPPRT